MISTDESNKIRNFLVMNGSFQTSDPSLVYKNDLSPCAAFACNLIEKATGRSIYKPENVFNQQDQYSSGTFNFLDYNSFLSTIPGALIGVYNVDLRQNPMRHFMVRGIHNWLFGVNHGGILLRRITDPVKGLVHLTRLDFTPDGRFFYDPPAPSGQPQPSNNNYLVSIDYTLI